MAYVRWNIVEELEKVARGKKTKTEPVVILRMIAENYLKEIKGAIKGR